MSKARLAAILAIGLGALALGVAAYSVISEFPRGPIIAALLIAAAVAAWHGLIRRGVARVAGVSCAALLVLAAVLFVILDGGVPRGAPRRRGGVRCPRRGQGRPRHPRRAPRRGAAGAPGALLQPEVRRRQGREVQARGRGAGARDRADRADAGTDLEQLVRDAVARGADGLAMAGGDGSQAIVASIAAELDLPYACIPAGTRNHFALDLGVDRDDVVGALDSFVDGGERRVDLAEVNGRVFVNNVSLGLYAEAVQREGYRDAKLRTILDTLPDALGPEGEGIDLQWTGPGGTEHSSGAAILVSNNLYRLGMAVGSGTRPHIDDGLLGITIAAAPTGGGGERQRPWREWSAPEFEVRAEGPIAAGIDGEALVLSAPLRFRILPSVLRVRIARQHPGASPSASIPERIGDVIRALLRRAAGRETPGAAAPDPGPTSSA